LRLDIATEVPMDSTKEDDIEKLKQQGEKLVE
jgi:hypothetical protein